MLHKEHIFYTQDHEWIAFLNTGTYIGISGFKLSGIRKIEDIRLFSTPQNDTLVRGTPLLHLFYKDYLITVHAPVDCKIMEVNPAIPLGLWEKIAQDPEGRGWLFKVEQVSKDRSHLVTKDVYQTRFPSPGIKYTL